MNDMQKLKRGDHGEFEKFYIKNRSAVFYAAFAVLKDEGLAEQIMQDAFVKFYTSLAELDDSKSPLSLVCTISKNFALNAYNRRKFETAMEDDKLDYFASDQTVYQNELTDLAAQILEERDFRVLMMITDGYKRKEVAKIMDLPVSTVTYIYKESLKKLKDALEEDLV